MGFEPRHPDSRAVKVTALPCGIHSTAFSLYQVSTGIFFAPVSLKCAVTPTQIHLQEDVNPGVKYKFGCA